MFENFGLMFHNGWDQFYIFTCYDFVVCLCILLGNFVPTSPELTTPQPVFENLWGLDIFHCGSKMSSFLKAIGVF